MRTLVLGSGNPILSDDSVGFRVIEQLRARLDKPGVTLMESCASGLSLLDLITGYDKLVIVDAIKTEGEPVGKIHRLTLDDLTNTYYSASPHQANLATTIELGRKLGEHVPQQITIFAVEVADVTSFSENCTPKVEQMIPVVTDMVIQELSRG